MARWWLITSTSHGAHPDAAEAPERYVRVAWPSAGTRIERRNTARHRRHRHITAESLRNGVSSICLEPQDGQRAFGTSAVASRPGDDGMRREGCKQRAWRRLRRQPPKTTP